MNDAHRGRGRNQRSRRRRDAVSGAAMPLYLRGPSRLRAHMFAALALAGSLASQGLHVVPTTHTTTDAVSFTAVVGIGVSDRQQIIIDAAALGPLVGRELIGLSFRRDWSDPSTLTGGAAQLVVRAGTATVASATAKPRFAANVSMPIEVFRGSINVPTSPPPGGSATWGPPNVVDISFSTPFLYAGGGLCLDLTGTVAKEFWWPVDAIEEPAQGIAISEGHACGPYATVHGDTFGVAERDLVVGETVLCSLFGRPRAPAFLLIGTSTFSNPIDLASIGAPGCELRVDAFASVPTTVSLPPFAAAFGGIAEAKLHLPADAGLAGASFVAQWCELPTGALATSNTITCTISTIRPSAGMSVVWSRGGSEPIVQFTRVPVVGLRWR